MALWLDLCCTAALKELLAPLLVATYPDHHSPHKNRN